MNEIALSKPSLRRYSRLFLAHRRGLSVFRVLTYERMDRAALAGTVFDFGGGTHAPYVEEMQRWVARGRGFEYQSANIDPAIRPTYLLKPGRPLPIGDESFDTALSLNTLEHIYELDDALAELGRVLKSGGRLVLAIPFMFRVHGHPDDYRRGTPSYWRRKLSEAGFDAVVVEALAWGPFSTGHAVSRLPGPFKSIRRHTGLLLDILWCTYRFRGMSKIVGRQDDDFLCSPLGYFIEACKAPGYARSGNGTKGAEVS